VKVLQRIAVLRTAVLDQLLDVVRGILRIVGIQHADDRIQPSLWFWIQLSGFAQFLQPEDRHLADHRATLGGRVHGGTTDLVDVRGADVYLGAGAETKQDGEGEDSGSNETVHTPRVCEAGAACPEHKSEAGLIRGVALLARNPRLPGASAVRPLGSLPPASLLDSGIAGRLAASR
jgi:hypothetical protein